MAWDNSKISPGINGVGRKPVFDIKISAQRRSAVSREVENQRAADLYGMGFFDPNRAQEAMIALDMMEFEGIDKVREKVMQGATLLNVLNQMNMQMQQMAMLLQTATGASVGGEMGGGRPAAQSGNARQNTLGARQQQALTANAKPYSSRVAGKMAGGDGA